MWGLAATCLGQGCVVRGFISAGLTTAPVIDRLPSPVAPGGGGIGNGILCTSNSQCELFHILTGFPHRKSSCQRLDLCESSSQSPVTHLGQGTQKVLVLCQRWQ